MYSWTWNWSWAWGWAVVVGVIFALAVFIIPWFFFLLNLRSTLDRVDHRNRAMPPDYVWLNFIPIFNLGWFIYTVVKVRDSVRAEYQSRGWRADGDFGYNVGLATGIIAIVSLVLGWTPFMGWGLNLAWLVCWIIYWLKTNELKNRLGETGAWAHTSAAPSTTPPPTWGAPPAGQAPYAGQPPYAGQYDGGSAPPAGGGGGEAAAASGARSDRCGACGTPFYEGDRFCRICGMPLPQGAGAGMPRTGAAPDVGGTDPAVPGGASGGPPPPQDDSQGFNT